MGRQTKAAPCTPSRASGINPAVEQATHLLPLPLWPPPFKQKQPPFWRLPRLEEGHLKMSPTPPRPLPATDPFKGQALLTCEPRALQGGLVPSVVLFSHLSFASRGSPE